MERAWNEFFLFFLNLRNQTIEASNRTRFFRIKQLSMARVYAVPGCATRNNGREPIQNRCFSSVFHRAEYPCFYFESFTSRNDIGLWNRSIGKERERYYGIFGTTSTVRKLFATVPFDSRDDRYYFFLIVGMKICGIDLKRIFVARFVIYLNYIGLATEQLRIFFLENQKQFFHGTK